MPAPVCLLPVFPSRRPAVRDMGVNLPEMTVPVKCAFIMAQIVLERSATAAEQGEEGICVSRSEITLWFLLE